MATVALSSLRAERNLGAGPKRVIESANKTLREATDPDSFTTLIYLTLDLRTGEVRWLNMGHPSPYVLRSGPTVSGYFVEGPRNKALGWFDEPGLAETVLGLEPGDRLVLFTDGFIEAKNAEGELFGDDRLAEVLLRFAPADPATLGDELIGEVERFAAGKLGDDLTMLVVEYQGTDG
jgi:serine phosphatase RsbU (regulator of sigma subunit)